MPRKAMDFNLTLLDQEVSCKGIVSVTSASVALTRIRNGNWNKPR